jgi:hypothetical protein
VAIESTLGAGTTVTIELPGYVADGGSSEPVDVLPPVPLAGRQHSPS